MSEAIFIYIIIYIHFQVLYHHSYNKKQIPYLIWCRSIILYWCQCWLLSEISRSGGCDWLTWPWGRLYVVHDRCTFWFGLRKTIDGALHVSVTAAETVVSATSTRCSWRHRSSYKMKRWIGNLLHSVICSGKTFLQDSQENFEEIYNDVLFSRYHL